MGKDLHHSILEFLENGLNKHQYVEQVIDISNEDYYIYLVKRNSNLRDVVILLSDEYYYSEFDYYSKPAELNEGGFILIAKPEASFDSQINYLEDRVITGKIGVLFGALRYNDYWTYQKPEKK